MGGLWEEPHLNPRSACASVRRALRRSWWNQNLGSASRSRSYLDSRGSAKEHGPLECATCFESKPQLDIVCCWVYLINSLCKIILFYYCFKFIRGPNVKLREVLLVYGKQSGCGISNLKWRAPWGAIFANICQHPLFGRGTLD